ncbi:MAG: YidC/Oxa1 family insertase periplasmic-domain containing protein [Planctomycetaceae bacterium]|nr:YidC/Oxa1 family insertase periplasmic-domain containing protein [Planctomycetaceae bacterium]
MSRWFPAEEADFFCPGQTEPPAWFDMDNRRFFLYLALSIGFYLIWINVAPRLFPGMFKPPVPEQVAADDDALNDNKPKATIQDEVEIPEPANFPTKTVELGTEGYDAGYLITAAFTTKGGSIAWVDLNDQRYTTLDRKAKFRVLGHEVDWLGQPGALMRLPNTCETSVKAIDDQLRHHKQNLREVDWEIVDQGPEHIQFRYPAPDGTLEVIKSYHIHKMENPADSNPAAYLIDFDLKIRNLSEQALQTTYVLQGPSGLPLENGDSTRVYREIKLGTLNESGDVTPIHMRAADVIEQTKRAAKGVKPVDTWREPIKYAGVDVQYFAGLILPREDQHVDVDGDGEPDSYFEVVSPLLLAGDDGAKLKADVSILLNSAPLELAPQAEVVHKLNVFAGPKRPDLLNPINARDVIYFGEIPLVGWLPPFSLNPVVARFIMWFLTYMHESFAIPYAFCIMAITVMVRGLMFPISVKQVAQAEKMKLLQPELKKLQDKYKDKPEEYARAMGDFQRKNNYNPIMGCLPMLLQIPIFFGLYGALGQAVDLRLAQFLWIDNLAGQDSLFDLPFTVPWFGWTKFNLLPIVTVALFITQQKLMTPPATSEDQEMMQKVSKYMMVVIGFMFYTVPAGLCLYIIVSSVWGFTERFLIRRFWPHIFDQQIVAHDAPAIVTTATNSGSKGTATATANPSENPSWFQRLLAAADEARNATPNQASGRGESNRKKKPKKY